MSESFNIETSWDLDNMGIDRTLFEKHNQPERQPPRAPNLLNEYKKLEKTCAFQRQELKDKANKIFQLQDKLKVLERQPNLVDDYKKLQKKSAAQTKNLKGKTSKIFELEETVKTLEAATGAQAVNLISALRLENTSLVKKVCEMEKFLAEYDLKWNGGTTKNAIDIRAVQRRVEELNVIAEQDASRWITSGEIRQYKALPQVPITFYANGVQIDGFLFEGYETTKT